MNIFFKIKRKFGMLYCGNSVNKNVFAFLNNVLLKINPIIKVINPLNIVIKKLIIQTR